MTGFLDTYLGETMALSAAIVWATAVILFKKSGESVHPIALNLFKGVLAIVLLIPIIPLAGEELFLEVPLSDLLIILASGALGIGIADTLFFRSLNLLGASVSAIVDCLYSPFIIGLSILWLGESMTFIQLIGVTMIISAILTTMGEKKRGLIPRKDLIKGILLGASAMATMAVGVVMVKPVLNYTPLLWITEVRIIGGVAILALALIVHPQRRMIVNSLRSPGSLGYTLSGSFMGGFLSMMLWLGGMKFTQASTAAALNQTSNIFVFIFAALFLKERITPLRLLAIILGVAGLFLVTLGK